jgi:hypothetical protein
MLRLWQSLWCNRARYISANRPRVSTREVFPHRQREVSVRISPVLPAQPQRNALHPTFSPTETRSASRSFRRMSFRLREMICRSSVLLESISIGTQARLCTSSSAPNIAAGNFRNGNSRKFGQAYQFRIGWLRIGNDPASLTSLVIFPASRRRRPGSQPNANRKCTPATIWLATLEPTPYPHRRTA